jgi:hypothetical protein
MRTAVGAIDTPSTVCTTPPNRLPNHYDLRPPAYRPSHEPQAPSTQRPTTLHPKKLAELY